MGGFRGVAVGQGVQVTRDSAGLASRTCPLATNPEGPYLPPAPK